MIIYTIYKCVNTVNGKVYVGFDSQWPNRQKKHKSKAKHNSTFHFHKAIKKHGWENFEWSILYQSKDRQHTLKVMEPYFIKEYDSFKWGYNSTLGGEGVFGLHRIQSDDEKKKRSDMMKGNQIAKNKGKPLSEERKLLLRKPRINCVLPLTEEHKQNISKSKIGKPKQKIQCPHCNKIGGFPQMKQWHFDKCGIN